MYFYLICIVFAAQFDSKTTEPNNILTTSSTVLPATTSTQELENHISTSTLLPDISSSAIASTQGTKDNHTLTSTMLPDVSFDQFVSTQVDNHSSTATSTIAMLPDVSSSPFVSTQGLGDTVTSDDLETPSHSSLADLVSQNVYSIDYEKMLKVFIIYFL